MGCQVDVVPLIAIVGETASGKTALALDLAKQFGGEIICADSRTVYKDMDIGTAKPTVEEQAMIRHHMLDIVSPNEIFTAADFKNVANSTIENIASRRKIPFLVGGTGLYTDALLYNFTFRGPPDFALRQKLQQMSVEQLQTLLHDRQQPLPHNAKNPRHLIRAIETGSVAAVRNPLRQNTTILGVDVEKDILRARIHERVERMMELGYVNEMKTLSAKYGWDAPGMQSPGHKAFRRYFDGDLSLEEAKTALVYEHLHLAKRQRTWFKRNKDIQWICKKEEAVDIITAFLNK